MTTPEGPVLPAGWMLNMLRQYRCQHHKYMDDGGGLLLVDMLTPVGDAVVDRGIEEVTLLADYIERELLAMYAQGKAEGGECDFEVFPASMSLYQGEDDVPWLLSGEDKICRFPAGSWGDVCDAFEYIVNGKSAQPRQAMALDTAKWFRTQFKYPTEDDYERGIVGLFQTIEGKQWFVQNSHKGGFSTANFGAPPEFWIHMDMLAKSATHPANAVEVTELRKVAKRNLRRMIEIGSQDKELMLKCLEELS